MTVALAAVRMTMPWHLWPSLACLRDGSNGGGADEGALASSTIPACLPNNNNSGILFELQKVPTSKHI
jgi:hypothetical protein